jgi:hypothetical protein
MVEETTAQESVLIMTASGKGVREQKKENRKGEEGKLDVRSCSIHTDIQRRKKRGER